MKLTRNDDLSRDKFPSEWKDSKDSHDGSSCEPDFSGGVVHALYDIPPALTDTDHRFSIEDFELHATGRHCQIITGCKGE